MLPFGIDPHRYNNFLNIRTRFTKMRSIKPTKLFKLEVCPDCSSQLETHAFTKYCPACQKCPTLFDTSMQPNQTLSVPNWNISYGHGGGDTRVPSSLVKIDAYLADLLCKLNVRLTSSETEGIKQKVRYMHNKRGSKCKGYREETAVLLFCIFEHQFRMTLHQFCEKTGLNRKKFNKIYLIYKNYIRQSQSSEQNDLIQSHEADQSEDMKLEIKREEQQSPQSKQQEGNQYLERQSKVVASSLKRQQNKQYEQQQYKHYFMLPHKKTELNIPTFSVHKTSHNTSFDPIQQQSSIKSSLQSLFPHIFPSSFLQTHKSQIQSSLCTKTAQLCQHYYESETASFLACKKYFRVPAALYCVIKMNNYKITIKKYIEIVDKVLNVKLTDRIIGKLMAIYRKQMEGSGTTVADDEGSSPTELDHQNNRSECPSIHENDMMNLPQSQKQCKRN